MIYTDARIQEDLNSKADGPRRTAEYLIEVPAEVRDDIMAEAQTMRNMTDVGRPSAAVQAVVMDYLIHNEVPTRYRDMAAAERSARQFGANRR